MRHSGAKDYQEWFDFIGLVKDKRFPPVGSPFQMNFPPGPPPGGYCSVEMVGQHLGNTSSGKGLRTVGMHLQVPQASMPCPCRPESALPACLPSPTLTESIAPLNSSIPSCGEGALACSCGDCPSAPGCEPPPPPPPPAPAGCPAVGTTSLSCTDLSLAALYVGLLACLPLVVRQSRQQLAESEARRLEQQLAGEPVAELEVGSNSLPRRRSGGSGRPEGRLLWESSEALSTAATAGSAAAKSRGEEAGEGGKDEIEEEEELVEWPATEQLLRQWFFHQVGSVVRPSWFGVVPIMQLRSRGVHVDHLKACMSSRDPCCYSLPQGLWCARRPRLVLALSLLAVGACALGLTRFRWGHDV